MVRWINKSLLAEAGRDRFSRFCTVHPFAQHTQTTERATRVAIGCIYAMHAIVRLKTGSDARMDVTFSAESNDSTIIVS